MRFTVNSKPVPEKGGFEESAKKAKTSEGHVKWVVIDSKVLGGRVVMVAEKRHLKDARRAFPGEVLYLPPEVEALKRLRSQMKLEEFQDALRTIHLAKVELDGWIVPESVKVLIP